MTRTEMVERFIDERIRHFNLPGRELDVTNSPNDWVAIVGRYVFEETRRGAVRPTRENFEDSLIKAVAVIMAALEHCAMMEKNEYFQESEDGFGHDAGVDGSANLREDAL
jgi:hypothetical protein